MAGSTIEPICDGVQRKGPKRNRGNFVRKFIKNQSEVASIYELLFGPVIIIFRTKIDF